MFAEDGQAHCKAPEVSSRRRTAERVRIEARGPLPRSVCDCLQTLDVEFIAVPLLRECRPVSPLVRLLTALSLQFLAARNEPRQGVVCQNSADTR